MMIILLCCHRKEISSLESKISEAKERYQHTVFSAKDSSKTMSALPQFPINDKFVLNQDEAWYTLSIELQVPIDTIMLQVHSGIGSLHMTLFNVLFCEIVGGG